MFCSENKSSIVVNVVDAHQMQGFPFRYQAETHHYFNQSMFLKTLLQINNSVDFFATTQFTHILKTVQ